MPPIPVLADFLTLVLGVLIGILGSKMWGKDMPSRLGAATAIGVGSAIAVVAIMHWPSIMLERWATPQAADVQPSAAPASVTSDDDSAEEDTQTIMVMGSRKELREFFLSFLREELEHEESEQEETVIEEDPEAARDPFKAPPIPTPEPTPAPPPPKPVRERTLATEPTDGNAACTHFTLLHGASGGPDEGGCFAVGCSEGYALPMQWKDGEGWFPCPAPTRLERLGECFYVRDLDGSERPMHYNETWKPAGKCG